VPIEEEEELGYSYVGEVTSYSGRVMRESAGMFSEALYPVLGFNLTVGRNKFTVICLNNQSYELQLLSRGTKYTLSQNQRCCV